MRGGTQLRDPTADATLLAQVLWCQNFRVSSMACSDGMWWLKVVGEWQIMINLLKVIKNIWQLASV